MSPLQLLVNRANLPGPNANDVDPQQAMCAQKIKLQLLQVQNRKQELLLQK